MALSERLALILTASTGGAVRGLREVKAAAEDMAKATGASEKELALLQKRSLAAQGTLKNALGLGALQSRLTQIGPAGVRMSAGIDRAVGSIANMNKTVLAANVASAAGFALLVKATSNGIEIFQEWASQARTIKAATGATAEQASRLAGTMRILGVDITAGARSFGILATVIQRTPEKLARYDVAIAKNRQGHADLEGTLLNIAQRYKELTDAGDKAAALDLAKSALGRGAQSLTPLLARGRDGIREFFKEVDKSHGVFSQKDLDAARDFKIAGRELTETWQGFAVQLGQAVIPAMTNFITRLREAVGFIQGIAVHLPPILGQDFGKPPKNDPFVRALRIQRDNPDLTLKQAQARAARDANAGYVASEEDVVKALQKARDAHAAREKWLNKAKNAVEEAISADRNLAQAQHSVAEADYAARQAAQGVADARRGVRDAQERLNDVLARGEDVTHRIEEAERALKDSALEVADAEERVVKARQALAKLAAGPSTRDRARAELAVRHATLGVAEANDRVADAQKRLDDARTGRGSGNRFATDADRANAVADAERDLAEAQLGVEDANNSLVDAQDALNELINAGKEGSEQYAEATRELRDAQRDLERAVHSHAEQQRALNDAQRGVAEHERDIRDAREGLADATRHVADAQHASAAAAYNAAQQRQALTDAVIRAAKAHQAELDLVNAGTTGLILYRAELEALARQSPALAAALAPILNAVRQLLVGPNIGGAPLSAFVPRFAKGAIIGKPAAYGDVYRRPTYALFGEAGPEMVLPLDPAKRAYAQSLLARSGLVGGWRNSAASPQVRAALGSAQAAVNTTTVAFTLEPGAIAVYASGRNEGREAGDEIVNKLVKWTNRNGPLPVPTRR